MMFVPTPAFSKPAAGQAPRWDDAQQRYVAASDPVLGTAAYKNVGTGASDVAAGDAPAAAGAAAVAAAGAYTDGVGAAAVATAEGYADSGDAATLAAAEAYAAGLVAALGARTKVFVATGLNFATTHTDAGTITGLPAKYIIKRLGFCDMSAVPGGAATANLRDTAGGAGVSLANVSLDGAFSSAAKVKTFTFDGGANTVATLTYQTAATLYLWMLAGNGSPLTGTAFIEIIDLT